MLLLLLLISPGVRRPALFVGAGGTTRCRVAGRRRLLLTLHPAHVFVAPRLLVVLPLCPLAPLFPLCPFRPLPSPSLPVAPQLLRAWPCPPLGVYGSPCRRPPRGRSLHPVAAAQPLSSPATTSACQAAQTAALRI